MSVAEFDYSDPAELYCGGDWAKGRTSIKYRKFGTAAEAIRHVVEELSAASRRSCILEVNEDRFRHMEVRELYDGSGYPLPRRIGKETDAAQETQL